MKTVTSIFLVTDRQCVLGPITYISQFLFSLSVNSGNIYSKESVKGKIHQWMWKKVITISGIHSLSVWDVLSHSVVFDSLWPHGQQPARLLCPCDSSGKNTRVGCHSLFQGIFATQGSNLCLHVAGEFFTIWATGEAPQFGIYLQNSICKKYGTTFYKSKEWFFGGWVGKEQQI